MKDLDKYLDESLRISIIERLRAGGVIFLSTDGVIIHPDAIIGEGTLIFPGTIILAGVKVGKNCKLGPNSLIEETIIGDGTNINSTQIYSSVVGNDCTIGPFVNIRAGTQINDGIKIGNFVELKKVSIDDGTSVAHLTYLGDSVIGKNVNIGCGVASVNYDGKEKHLTVIGDGAFIGCNNSLVAPISIGKNAYTAAGSALTEDVPDGALAIARARQVNKENYASGRYENANENEEK